MKYTFAIQWPPPFAQGWQRSGKRWNSIKEASLGLAEFLEVSLENGTVIEGKLVEVDENA